MARMQQGHGVTLLQGSTGLRYRKMEKADEIHQEGKGEGGKESKQKESLAVCQQRQPQLVVIW